MKAGAHKTKFSPIDGKTHATNARARLSIASLMRNSSATLERSMRDDDDVEDEDEEDASWTIERCLRVSAAVRSAYVLCVVQSRCARPRLLARSVPCPRPRVAQGARPPNRRTIGNFQRPLLDDSQKVAEKP